MLAVVFFLTGFSPESILLSTAGYCLGSFLVIRLVRVGYPHPALGAGNFVTLMRMALASALLASVLGQTLPIYFIAIATIALVLDGLDGWLARRAGRVSNFGARLDIEVDSAFAMVLALNVWMVGNAGPLIILFALPRYIFLFFTTFLPWLGKPLPSRIGGKVVGVIQIISLIVLTWPNLPSELVTFIIAAVSAGLVWSFGRDIILLYRQRLNPSQ